MKWSDLIGRCIGGAASLWLSACILDRNGPADKPADGLFPLDVEGLEEAAAPRTLDLLDGDSLVLMAAPVRKRIDGRDVRMLAFDGSIPGPVLRVPQGATLRVKLRNRLGLSAALHAQGVRMDNRYDGATVAGQAPIEDGMDGDYVLTFPDPGAYWYRSQVRDDYTQPLGLYGTIVVTPKDPGYWNPVDREVPLILGDVLVDSAGMVPYRRDKADHAVMGRYGNVFLVNGDTAWTLTLRRKEYVRFYLTNASSARVFNFYLTRTYLKLVGADNGRYERSILSQGELVGPGERSIFEAAFRDSGVVELIHEMPDRVKVLGRITVLGDSVTTGHDAVYGDEDTNHLLIRELDSLRARFDGPPDKELLLTGIMTGPPMKVAGEAHYPGSVEGIEWFDHMGSMNSGSTPDNMVWILRDMQTGLENHAIRWRFKRGDRVMIRIRNDPKSAHVMPHPIHFHGQRFLVVNVDGVRNPNLAWRDTYLVGTGSTTDILLEAENPGEWMAQCQIPEHLEASMMLHYRID